MAKRIDRQACLRALAAASIAAVAAGCALNSENSSAFVDPGKFEFLTCQELGQRTRAAIVRERELSALIEKTSTSPGSALIAAQAYKPDLLMVQGELKLARQVSQRRNCESKWSSEGIIR